jgi:hypothetical protein
MKRQALPLFLSENNPPAKRAILTAAVDLFASRGICTPFWLACGNILLPATVIPEGKNDSLKRMARYRTRRLRSGH